MNKTIETSLTTMQEIKNSSTLLAPRGVMRKQLQHACLHLTANEVEEPK